MRKKLITIGFIVAIAGCENMAPIKMGVEVDVLGIAKVKPQFEIGDGVIGPTGVEVERIEENAD